MGLLGRADFALANPARRPGHALRFWDEITRGVEKWVKLSLGHFFGYLVGRYRAPFAPKPGRMTQSPRSVRYLCALRWLANAI
jgi:hypothetical protein